jgi:radical SAM superfamily enzyme YgiQ (UPF0313 family)
VGKRVVSTQLPEIVKFNQDNDNIVDIAIGKEAFSDAIRNVLKKPLIVEYVKRAVETAKKNAWDSRIDRMSELISETEYMKNLERKRRGAALSGKSVAGAFVLFYCPFSLSSG